ncbi:hypothetical protein BB558_005185 [Smittium angustum]|uniref:Protein arginine methyltransferase NDUFAF7 n=1 Tax=Smittium angustum TaxID=133377 RepID=A0A2U1J160_SMIAN|nr:hypothetical protein BB558_005185 [Smittium angustum]
MISFGRNSLTHYSPKISFCCRVFSQINQKTKSRILNFGNLQTNEYSISKPEKKKESQGNEKTEENKVEKITSTLFGPWWPKAEGNYSEDSFLEDLGPRVTFQDLVTKKFKPEKQKSTKKNKNSFNVVEDRNTSVIPRHIHMLSSDFINNSLYNPDYGYFSKQALIFSSINGFNFNKIRDTNELLGKVGEMYGKMEKELDGVDAIPRQIWHTPTELLKPYYAHSIARCILEKHKKKCGSEGDSKPLVIYEIGAGNGTLMVDIIKYIMDTEPNVFETMEYNVVEISSRLVRKQMAQKFGTKHKEITKRINIYNKSILEWNQIEERDCIVLIMEVIDNFPHDVIRYNYTTGEPYESLVYIDKDGEFHEALEPVNSPQIVEYLDVCKKVGYKSPIQEPTIFKKMRSYLPLAPNTTDHEFLPTYMYNVYFYELPDSTSGVNAPVVQTRYKGNMVPCSTFMVQPGWFDIFFPVDFELLSKVYYWVYLEKAKKEELQMDKPIVLTQEEFARKYADLEKTCTKSGENPMIDLYRNNKFLIS